MKGGRGGCGWCGWRALLAVIGLIGFGHATAAPLVLDPGAGRVGLTTQWALFEDRSGTLDLADVRARDAEFTPATEHRLTPGYTGSAWWARLELTVPAGAPVERWLVVRPARLEEAALWQEVGGQWQVQHAGMAVPHAQWPLDTPMPAFRLALPPGRNVVLYLRTASRSALAIDALLCEPQACRTAEHIELWVDASLLGVSAVMAFSAFLLGLALRQDAFLWLVLSLIVYVLYEAGMRGYAFQYLWPVWPEFALRVLSLLVGLFVVFHSMFVRQLLNLHFHTPRLHTLVKALMALVIGGMLVSSLGPYTLGARITALGMLLLLSALTAAALVAWRRGVRHGGSIAVGLVLLTASCALRGLELTGALPRSWITIYCTPLCQALNELVVIGGAILNVASWNRERLAAQKELLTERAGRQSQLEREVAERTDALTRALEASRVAQAERTRLLAYIGHDLRAPLAATLAYTRNLAQGDTPGASGELREAVERGMQHQLELIDEIIELARGELDELELLPAPTYLHALLHDLHHDAELLAQAQRNLVVQALAPHLPPVVSVDAKRLRQVLLNLLSNAAKFTEDGRITLRVEVLPAPLANVVNLRDGAANLPFRFISLRFSVSDTGPGIAAGDRERVFEPFHRAVHRTDTSRPGSGLGLAVARQIVEAMGGSLALHGEPAQGSRFSFDLVLQIAAEADVPRAALLQMPTPPFGTGKVALVVDDDAACRDEWAELLFSADFDVLRAESAEAALGILQSTPVDLVVTDLRMAGADGRSLRTDALASLGNAAPRFVLASSLPAAAADRATFDGVLLKPVSAPAALQLLQRLFASEARVG